MQYCEQKALVACGDVSRRAHYATQFLHAGWNVHTVREGRELHDLMLKQRYGIALIDDSLEHMGCAEAVLTIRDVARNHPMVVVAGNGGTRHTRLWAQTDVALNTDHAETARRIPELIHECEAEGIDDPIEPRRRGDDGKKHHEKADWGAHER